MTNRTFRALRFSKSAGMSDRCGAAHLADFTIPFWIDATDAGTLFAQKFALVTAVALESFGIFLRGRRPSIDLLHKLRGLILIAWVIQIVPGSSRPFQVAVTIIPKIDRKAAVIAGGSGACRHDENRIAAKERKERRKSED